MFKRAICTVFSLVLLTNSAFASTFDIVNSGESTYKKITMTPSVYSATNKNLGGITIWDEKGDIVPYFLNRYEPVVPEILEQYKFDVTDYGFDEYGNYIIFENSGNIDQPILVTSVKFNLENTDFLSNFDFFGSYDSENWDYILSDTIFLKEFNSNDTFDINGCVDYKNYKLYTQNPDGIFEYMNTFYSEGADVNAEKIEKMQLDFLLQSNVNEFTVQINDGYNILVDSLEVELGNEFQGQLIIDDLTFDIFNKQINDEFANNLTILLGDLQLSETTQIKIIPDDNYDKPEVLNIIARYYPHEIIFKDSENYPLKLDVDSTQTVGVKYQIESQSEEILNENIDELELVNMQETEHILVNINANSFNLAYLFIPGFVLIIAWLLSKIK